MQLSNKFHPYKQPACIVVADAMHAKLFHANGRTVELLKELRTDRMDIKDIERIRAQKPMGDSTMQSTMTDEHMKEVTRDEFFRTLADELQDLLQQKACEEFQLVLPEEYFNAFESHLHPDVKNRVSKTVRKHLVNADLEDIIQNLQTM